MFIYKGDGTVYNRSTFYLFPFIYKGCGWNLFHDIKSYIKIIIPALLVVIGLIYFYMTDSFDKEIANDDLVEGLTPLDENLAENTVEREVVEEGIVVDIKGEINSPGVYDMQIGDRMVDIIEQSDGLTKDADESQINLAQKLQDEMVIIIPKEGDEVAELHSSSMESSRSTDITEKVNINQATQSELETLNGIGPSKAEAIITYREENGLFQTVEDILEVNGIGEKMLESIQDHVVVH